MNKNKQFISVREAAEEIGCRTEDVRRVVDAGKVKWRWQTVPGSTILIFGSEIEKLRAQIPSHRLLRKPAQSCRK